MSTDSIFRGLAYLIVAAGLGIALIIATVPNYAMAHHLLFSAFLLTAIPYLIYGAFVPFMNGILALAPGLILLGLQLSQQVPAWLTLEQPVIPEAYFNASLTGVLITVPLMLIFGWLSRRKSPAVQAAG